MDVITLDIWIDCVLPYLLWEDMYALRLTGCDGWEIALYKPFTCKKSAWGQKQLKKYLYCFQHQTLNNLTILMNEDTQNARNIEPTTPLYIDYLTQHCELLCLSTYIVFGKEVKPFTDYLKVVELKYVDLSLVFPLLPNNLLQLELISYDTVPWDVLKSKVRHIIIHTIVNVDLDALQNTECEILRLRKVFNVAGTVPKSVKKFVIDNVASDFTDCIMSNFNNWGSVETVELRYIFAREDVKFIFPLSLKCLKLDNCALFDKKFEVVVTSDLDELDITSCRRVKISTKKIKSLVARTTPFKDLICDGLESLCLLNSYRRDVIEIPHLPRSLKHLRLSSTNCTSLPPCPPNLEVITIEFENELEVAMSNWNSASVKEINVRYSPGVICDNMLVRKGAVISFNTASTVTYNADLRCFVPSD